MSDKPFSERMGFVLPKPVQIDDLDNDARTALYNLFMRVSKKETQDNPTHQYWIFVGTKFLKIEENELFEETAYLHVIHSYKMQANIRNLFFDYEWYNIFNLIEFISSFSSTINCSLKSINSVLEQEKIGYKFVGGKFIPIQTQEEQETIENALQIPYENARNHIEKSITLFSARPNPDYANSIKESICAVESICKELTGETKFADAVRKLNIPMHQAFREATIKLYGFTSDEEGIRHAATGEPLQINQATARYMLNVCSAMVNYITANTDKK